LVLEWVPPFLGSRWDPLYRGDGEGLLVHGEKKEEYREAGGEIFLASDPLYHYFLVLRMGKESC
jgi:hypothetical protein